MPETPSRDLNLPESPSGVSGSCPGMGPGKSPPRAIPTALGTSHAAGKQAEVLTVALLLEILFRDELEGGGVHAVPEAGGGRPQPEEILILHQRNTGLFSALAGYKGLVAYPACNPTWMPRIK
jgi:hypothetical protein